MSTDAAATQRAAAARILIACGLALGILLSWKLWFPSDRLFPERPLVGFLGSVPTWVDAVLTLAAIAGSIAFAAKPSRVWPAVVALCAGLLLAALDQIRWQPWCYQYWLSIVALCFLADRTNKSPRPSLEILRWISVATYLWSGIHKCNAGFAHFYREGFAKDLLASTTGPLHKLLDLGAVLAAPTEILIAILLTLVRTRNIGVVLAAGMHLLILCVLGPFSDTENSVIWPWNIVMIGLNIALFWRSPTSMLTPLPKGTNRVLAYSIAILIGVMPALSIARAWPNYLSFHLYSGQGQRLQLVLFPRGVQKLPPEYQKILIASPVSDQLKVLDPMTWALREFHCPAIDRSSILLATAQELTVQFGLDAQDGFFYFDFPNYLSQRGWKKFTPEEILAMKDLPELPRSRQIESSPPGEKIVILGRNRAYLE